MERRIGKQDDDLAQAAAVRSLFGFWILLFLQGALVAWESNNWKISMVGKFYELKTREDKKSN